MAFQAQKAAYDPSHEMPRSLANMTPPRPWTRQQYTPFFSNISAMPPTPPDAPVKTGPSSGRTPCLNGQDEHSGEPRSADAHRFRNDNPVGSSVQNLSGRDTALVRHPQRVSPSPPPGCHDLGPFAAEEALRMTLPHRRFRNHRPFADHGPFCSRWPWRPYNSRSEE